VSKIDVRWMYAPLFAMLLGIGTCSYNKFDDVEKKVIIIETKIDRMAWDIGDLRQR